MSSNPQPAPPLDLAQFTGHTPGDWIVKPTGSADQAVIYSESDPRGRNLAVVYDYTNADGALMAAAPALLAECQRQRAEIERLRAALSDAIAGMSHHPTCRNRHNIASCDCRLGAARAALQQTGEESK